MTPSNCPELHWTNWSHLIFIGFSKLNQTTQWFKSIRNILFNCHSVKLFFFLAILLILNIYLFVKVFTGQPTKPILHSALLNQDRGGWFKIIGDMKNSFSWSPEIFLCLDICLSKSRFNHIRDYRYWVTYEPISDTIEIQRCDQFEIQINDQTNVREKIKVFYLKSKFQWYRTVSNPNRRHEMEMIKSWGEHFTTTQFLTQNILGQFFPNLPNWGQDWTVTNARSLVKQLEVQVLAVLAVIMQLLQHLK